MPLGQTNWYGEGECDGYDGQGKIMFKEDRAYKILTCCEEEEEDVDIHTREGIMHAINLLDTYNISGRLNGRSDEIDALLSNMEIYNNHRKELEYMQWMSDKKMGPHVYDYGYYGHKTHGGEMGSEGGDTLVFYIAIEMDRYPYNLRHYLSLHDISEEESKILCEGVQDLLWKLAIAGILNIDTKPDNIVYNDNTKEMRLIDFDPNYFIRIGVENNNEAILLFSIMLILYYYFSESYCVGKNKHIFRALPTGNIGYYAEPWQNKKILAHAGHTILASEELLSVMIWYSPSVKQKLTGLIDYCLTDQRVVDTFESHDLHNVIERVVAPCG